MAHGRRRPQKNKLLDEQIREQRARVDRKVNEEHILWCNLIAERRAEAKLTRPQLAKLAGISVGTLKNIEHVKRKSIAPDTLNRLRSIPLLRLPISIGTDASSSAEGYHAIWMPRYNPNYGCDLAQAALRWRWDRLPYCSLHHSKESTDLYQFLNSCGEYGNWLNQMPPEIRLLISCIYKHLDGEFDFICLTIGHGWTDLKLAESLLSDESHRMRNLWLVSPNIHLLSHGLHVYNKQMRIPERHGSAVGMVLGKHEEYVNNLRPIGLRKRVFLLLGALINHDSGEELLNLISNKAQAGDVLIFDITLPCGELGNRNSIISTDPRLSGVLPLSFIESVEKWIEPAIKEIDSTIFRIDWSYGIDDFKKEKGRNLETYSIDMRAKILREHSEPQDLSVSRIHRHSPELLEKFLNMNHWSLISELIQGQLPEINYPGRVLVFLKH